MGKEVGCHLAHNVKVQNSTLAIQQSTIFGRYFDEITCFLTHVCGFLWLTFARVFFYL